MAFCAMDLPLRVPVADLAHRDEPLVGQHRLDELPGAFAARDRQSVLFPSRPAALRFEIGHHLFAGDEAVQP